MSEKTASVVLSINLRLEPSNDWHASVFGYDVTKHFYAASLPAVLLKVASYAEGNSIPNSVSAQAHQDT